MVTIINGQVFGDNGNSQEPKEPKVLNEVRAGERINYDGAVIVKGNVGEGAYINATGLKVEGGGRL